MRRGAAPPKLSLSPPAGFVSWRDTTSGSWYIETLDGVLEQWAHCEDLLTLLLRVRLLAGAGGERILPRWFGSMLSRAPSPNQRFLLHPGLP